MQYVSTRGEAKTLGFSDVILEGLATDGGLYVPDTWPALDVADTHTYAQTAVAVMWPFVSQAMPLHDFESLVDAAYSTFRPPSGAHPDVVPVTDLGDHRYLAELYWGPTLAFKDIALQLLGGLFDYELGRRGERATIVGATSGDTGSAAIEACRDREHLDIFILHPYGRTSEVQRRQMTTVTAPNVFNIAVEGSFDDCQDIVKALFGDETFRRRRQLSAVNSINWARVMAQIVYYVTAAREVRRREGLGPADPVNVCVPTGNFGNVFAGYAAMCMGEHIGQFHVASNANDILTRFFANGSMDITEVISTLSPSMDIQVSSNLERLLFEMMGRNGQALAGAMREFREVGSVSFEPEQHAWLSERWSGDRLNDDECIEVMRRYGAQGVALDPHSAVGVGVAERIDFIGVPTVCMGTAHPAKFPDAVERATGSRPALPPHLGDIYDREERYTVLPNDVDAVRTFVDQSLPATS